MTARKEIASLSKTTLSLGKGIAVGATGLAAAGVAGFAAFASSASKSAANMEDLSLRLEVLTGSADSAKSMIAEFRKEAAKSPLSVDDYAQAGQLLMQFGTDAKDVLPTLKMLGDVSMGNSERFGGMALALGQVIEKKRLQGQEKNQLSERGFNPVSWITKRTGEEMDAFMKRMEDGKVSSQEVLQAFKDATSEGGKFYGAIDKASTGTNAKIAQLKDTVESLKISFGNGFNDGLKVALQAADSYLPSLESKFTEAGQVIGGAITEAVQGKADQLFAIGAFMGEVISNGFEAVFLKAMDEILAKAQNAFAVFTEQFRAFATKGELMGINEAAGNVVKKGKVNESASLSSYLQTALEDSANSGALKSIRESSEKNKAEKKKKDAAALLDAMFGEGSKATKPTIDMSPIAAKVDDKKANHQFAQADPYQYQDRNIDDYQRRGLSMSKNPGAVQDKIFKVQEQIRDILKDAKIQGRQLLWT